MPDQSREHDDVFAERVARLLRAPEHLDDDFDRALVDAIRADRPIERSVEPRRRPLSPSWWRTPRTLRMSPIAALALAASIAAVAALGGSTLAASRPTAASPTVAAAGVAAPRDTVTFVRFVFVGPATSVSLVGDFNAWGAHATPLHATGANGAWSVSIPVPRGRHEYAFIVDGKRWTPDPYAPTSSDDFDTKSSVLTVGS